MGIIGPAIRTNIYNRKNPPRKCISIFIPSYEMGENEHCENHLKYIIRSNDRKKERKEGKEGISIELKIELAEGNAEGKGECASLLL